MSKKMWNKIFKSKSQKPQPLGKINKRHSRGIYEEYQQLNDLLAGEKAQLNFSQNEKENDHGNGCGNGNGNGNGNINVFEQQPQQSSFNSLQLSEAQQEHHHHHQQQQQQQLSTFSRVRNTFSLKRNKKQPTNAKSSESDTPASVGAASKIDEIATATAAEATATAATSAILTNQSHANQLQRVLIVVNKIDVATNSPTNHHLHANPTKTPATAIKSTINATTDLDAEEPIRGTDDDPLPPPPPPLTTGLSVPVPEYVPAQSSDLTPCPCCSRTFNVNALRKHIVICEKSSKKRKVFDSSRQRREGTSLSTYVLPKNFGLPNAERNPGVSPPCTSREAAAALAAAAEPVSSPIPVRRKSQTEMVRSTARASLRKTASTLSNNSGDTAVATGAPAPAAVATSAPAAAPPAPRERSLAKRIKGPACDRCPHCDRTFNPKAFDRHVEWCKEKAIQATMKSGNSQETSKAKERLEARKQYRPPNLKTKRSLARDKYSGHHEEVLEAGDMSTPKPNMMSLSMTSSVHSDNGLGDKYDPFLSAKRQLEELCSPNTPPPEEEIVMTTTKPKTPLTATPFAAPSISMTTSLTSSVLGSRPAPVTPKVQPVSNFRRTSSLRGPRRTPLLPSRPLFATNYRPTIQRGLSDEGPISTNFLKPEEYDEMPVRAACGNDFHSPRVVRRDTSASNRKQMMKLPVGGASTEAGPSSPQPTRSVAKTDSLAVFLKYEHELEQLNAKAAATELATQLTSKDLKDKSNNLSKQNSAKSLGQSTPTTTTATTQLPPLTPVAPMPQSPTVAKDISSYPPIVTPLRLEPINKPMTPIKLESIFGPRRETTLGSGLGSTTASVAGDYIDPKLINACDNLHVNSGVSSDASSTPQQLSQSRSRSSSQSTIVHERRQSGEARNLLKRKMRLGRNQFLYDASPEDAGDASSGCSADDEANRSSMEFDEQCWQQQQKQLLTNPLPMVMPMVQHAHSNMPTFDDFDFEEFLSSFENENDDEQFPLFKDCREFLLNRSTSRQRSFQKATSTPQPTATQQQHHHNNQSNNNHKSKDVHAHRSDSNMSGMTDVSSQHEEKQSRQAEIEKQTRLAEIEKQNRLAEIEKQSRLAEIEKQSRLAELEMQTRLAEMEKQNRLAELETQSRLAELEKRAAAEDQQKREIFNRNSAEDQQKREIFISIETEANAQGRSPISPDSLRHMVGNSQTPIDVLHIENGNEPEHARFSKISDTEDAGEEPGDRPSQLNSNRLVQSSSSCALAPNVQLNNAKNLIQKMQSDFRQLGEEASASMRRTLIANSGRSEEQQQMRDPEPNSQQQQQHQFQQQQMQHQQEKPSSPLTPSPSADSDELSSLDSYTMLSRGAGSKLSTDSAYGSNSPFSLSRQRSSELQPGTPRSQGLLRPHTANAKLAGNMSDASTQAHTKYGTLKARQRLFSNNGSSVTSNNGNGDGAESSSSGSENSLEVQQKQQQQQHTSNYNYQQQQQHQTQSQPAYKTNTINNNTTVPMTPTTSQHSLLSNTSNTSSMSSSMKMSKFCHECGAKFIVEQAKFCMECGVRRMVL
ncbi:uncharacterized protein Dana_GF13426, isoform F [Drosophila ananassae]|uniref:Uncharacterized protein, isoform F n=1 Tax=Drosophila ananassae TaxID=7217 RepID=B3MD64_DROAN|nr:uncharacterized protein LOC6496268 isoform X2 [Drosophila ananassae]EDV37397.2 uncharacterized protein Dana_GF13426, isoform F [Drosophila ananassae]